MIGTASDKEAIIFMACRFWTSIGGLVIRIDDRVVDSSIKTKIETMSKALAQS
jgi:hypothetical protein